MSYIFQFRVTGTGTVNIYRNNILKATSIGGEPLKSVILEYGDIFRQECIPPENFIGASNNIDNTIETNPNYSAPIIVSSFAIIVTFAFKQITPLCTSLAVDTWKPTITNLKTGENLPITVRSKEINKSFNIGYADAITLERHVILSGTTDASGCFTGEIPAQADGTYNLTVCFLFLNISCPITAPVNPISITWGTKPLDIQTMILYAALGLGAAYIIGQVIAKDGRNN